MPPTMIELSTPGMVADHRGRAVLAAQELVCGLMAEKGVGRAELGRRLGWSAGRLRRFFRATDRLDVGEVAAMLGALGKTLEFAAGPARL